jgi:hypothetical protein
MDGEDVRVTEERIEKKKDQDRTEIITFELPLNCLLH